MSDPSRIKLSFIPEDWKPKKVNAVLKEQPFVKLNKPGEWSEYCFTPKFDGIGKQKVCTLYFIKLQLKERV